MQVLDMDGVVNIANHINNKVSKPSNNGILGQALLTDGEEVYWGNPVSTYVYNSSWIGKKFIAFGTSLTRKCDDYVGGYLEVIRKRLGFTSYTNMGISGASMISNGINGVTDNILDAILNADLTDYDLIILECTSNDFKLNVPIGTVGIMGDTGFDTTTFCGAVRTAIEHILTNYPTKHILLIADTPRDKSDGYNVNYTNSAGHKFVDYVDALIEIKDLYGLELCDWFRKSGINNLTLDTYTTDRVHLNDLGYRAVGNLTASTIGNMYCIYDGVYEPSVTWTDTLLIMDGIVYDISVSKGYEYKMLININDVLYLYYGHNPFKIYKEGYRECWIPDCYRASNGNDINIFDNGLIIALTEGLHENLGDGYYKMNKDRELDQYVASNHDIYYWGTNDVAVSATSSTNINTYTKVEIDNMFASYANDIATLVGGGEIET